MVTLLVDFDCFLLSKPQLCGMKNCIPALTRVCFEFINGYKMPYDLMGDKNLTLFVYKKHHGQPYGAFWLVLTLQASSTQVKIHPSGDHAPSYRQRGWDFIYVVLNIITSFEWSIYPHDWDQWGFLAKIKYCKIRSIYPVLTLSQFIPDMYKAF